MIEQFTHTLCQARYWIEESQGRAAILGKEQDRGQTLDYQTYRAGFRKIASSTNTRTMIATVISPNFQAENFQSVLRCSEGSETPPNNHQCLYLVSVWNSFIVDYALRSRISANINFFYVYQLPVPRLTTGDKYFTDIVQRAAKLICTAPEFDELAQEVGLNSHREGVTDETERAKLRAELDGIIAHLYGLTDAEFAYILTTFPIVPETVKQAALEAYRTFLCM